jgi:hypothetical protein
MQINRKERGKRKPPKIPSGGKERENSISDPSLLSIH